MLAPHRCGWGAPGRAHVGEKGSFSSGTPAPRRHPGRCRLCKLRKAWKRFCMCLSPQCSSF